MTLLARKPLLTVGELKEFLKNVPDDIIIRYKKANLDTELDKTSPIHDVENTDDILFLITYYSSHRKLTDY